VLTSILRIRSLQNYVKKWKKEVSEAAASGQPHDGFSTGNNTKFEDPTSNSSYDGNLPLCSLSDLTSISGPQSANASAIAMQGYIPSTNTFAAAGAPGNSTHSQSGGARSTSDGSLVVQAPEHAQPAALKPGWLPPNEYTDLNAFSSGFDCSAEYAEGSDAAFQPPSFTQPSAFDSPSRLNVEQGNAKDNANYSVDWPLWVASDGESR
jgi:hypothetical protein